MVVHARYHPLRTTLEVVAINAKKFTLSDLAEVSIF